MKEHQFSQDIQELNSRIGLASPNGRNYKERLHKHQQVLDYYTAIKSIVKKLSTKRTLYLYDCSCGKSYLSFYLNHLLKRDGFNNVSFVCIDSNKEIIERCKQAASKMEVTNMVFYDANIIDFKFREPPDIVYSLHACDSATDQTIYKGIIENARYILSVSCCQHTMRNQMKKHPLSMVTRHQPYKERLIDMVSDSLRALILESFGYRVIAYEFVATAYTPKNVMLKCEKIQQTSEKIQSARVEYEKLSKLFNIHPMLKTYLQ